MDKIMALIMATSVVMIISVGCFYFGYKTREAEIIKAEHCRILENQPIYCKE